MTDLFLDIVNRSITASILVLLVFLLRLLFAKAPRWIHVLLWSLVAIRLICPFSIESTNSLIPKTDWIGEERISSESIHEFSETADGIKLEEFSSADEETMSETLSHGEMTGTSEPRSTVAILSRIWIAGTAVMLIYLIISYFRVFRHIRQTEFFCGNVYTGKTITSPFVFGWIRPRICLPENMDAVTMSYVIAHEEAHIRRRDHWWKPLGFLLLAVYWFQPLMWPSYILFCRDIELACDERVIRDYTGLQRADYSEALLECSGKRQKFFACPPAFGEAGVKLRVRSVLFYKEPAFWQTVLALGICYAAAVCLLTDPVTGDAMHSLYAEPDPVMEIRVWQRNEKETLDYPDIHPNHRFFYNTVPLTLREGENVEISAVPRMVYGDTILDVLYDGDLRGHYDIAARNMVFYTGEADLKPANHGGGGITLRMNDDGTFEGNRKMTLSIANLNMNFMHSALTGSDPEISLFHEDEFKDKCKIERFHEVYPEAGRMGSAYSNLTNFKRIVLTNYLTVQAMHPTKPDTPVATAVLEITTYSSWYGADLNTAELEYVFDRCDPNCNSGKVTVVSYEQSDFFGME